MTDRLLTAREVAVTLGVCLDTAYDVMRRIGVRRPTGGRSVRVRESDLQNYIDSTGEGSWDARTSRKRATGYGAFRVRGQVIDAHVVAYELAHGARPLPGLCVTHRCDNRRCCNPRHLHVGTPLDNFKDMVARGRSRLRRGDPPHVPGELHGAAKLTWDDVRELRSLAAQGWTLSELSDQFGVHRAQVRRIILGERWKEPHPPDAALALGEAV